jgi:hypothetical protein
MNNFAFVLSAFILNNICTIPIAEQFCPKMALKPLKHAALSQISTIKGHTSPFYGLLKIKSQRLEVNKNVHFTYIYVKSILFPARTKVTNRALNKR